MVNRRNNLPEKKKKTFWEGKFWQWTKKNAPDVASTILSTAGDLTGVELFNRAGELISGSNLPPEKKVEALELRQMELEAEIQAQQELTKRHRADMASDSWLSKNIRPLTLIVTFGLMTLFAVADGNLGNFTVKKDYIEMIRLVFSAAVSFYFIGRTVEKIVDIRSKKE